MGWHHHGAQSEPGGEIAFEIKSVTNQCSGLPRDRLKNMATVDSASMDRVEGELDQPARNIFGARVADVSVTAACALGKRAIEDHRAPVRTGPQRVLGRSQTSQQHGDTTTGDVLERSLVDIPDPPRRHSATPGPTDMLPVRQREPIQHKTEPNGPSQRGASRHEMSRECGRLRLCRTIGACGGAIQPLRAATFSATRRLVASGSSADTSPPSPATSLANDDLTNEYCGVVAT